MRTTRPSRTDRERPMSTPVADRVWPRTPDRPLLAAGVAHEAEADPVQPVTAEIVVVDAERDPAYSDAVPFVDHRVKSWYTEAEALRQSRLRRWQEQR